MKRLLQIIAALFTVSRLFAAEDTALAAPLPPLDTVIQGVIDQANRENGDEQLFKQHYSYTRARITDYLNSDGDVKSTQQKTSDKSPWPTNAPPRVRKNHAPAKPLTPEQKEAAFDKKDFVLTRDLVDRFDLTLVDREMIRGRPTLLINFKPKSGPLPDNNIKDRFINHAAGQLWIDEKDYAVTKADVHLTQQVNFFGGVAGAIWKFNFTLDRGRTDDGLWYILNMNWHLEGREVLFSKYMDYHELWTNVRKTQ
ncbi:MAG TPA: hypothetical protein VH255_00065 [Verrucomicrobiae bacterium]|jgi:hypothetical protein|nr:hypothetical protein [Verrucomicrobiae bacterium]